MKITKICGEPDYRIPLKPFPLEPTPGSTGGRPDQPEEGSKAPPESPQEGQQGTPKREPDRGVVITNR